MSLHEMHPYDVYIYNICIYKYVRFLWVLSYLDVLFRRCIDTLCLIMLEEVKDGLESKR